MKNGIKAAALAAFMLPAAAMAEINYSYVEGGLAFYPSFGNQDFIGGTARGAFELEAIDPNVFALGGITFLTDDVDLTAFHVGGGYKFEVDTQTDVWGGATIEYQEIESTGSVVVCEGFSCTTESRTVSFDDTSLGFRGGVRHMLDENFELASSARLVTGDLDYFGIAGTVRYHWQDNLNFLGEVDLYDGELGFIGGVQLNF